MTGVETTTLLYIAIASAAASAAAGAYSAYESGKASKRAAEYNAQIEERNAQLAKQAADLKAEDARKATARRLASIRAGYASEGLSIDEGTPLLVLMDSAAEGAKEQVRIKYGADVESGSYLSNAALSRMKGEEAYKQGVIGAGASLLTGASRTAGLAYGYKMDQEKLKMDQEKLKLAGK